MNYPLILVPVALNKPFFEMNRKEAQQYLNWFLSIKEERLQLLNENVVLSGNEKWVFDFSPDSLIPLFDWFKSVITTRDKTKKEKEIEESKITDSLKGFIDLDGKTFTNETISLCSDVGMYFGEVLRKEKELEWSFVLKPKRFVDYAQPILVKEKAKMVLNPRRIMENVARDVLDNSSEENELLKLYNIWKGYF